jgi:hypothetical protein
MVSIGLLVHSDRHLGRGHKMAGFRLRVIGAYADFDGAAECGKPGGNYSL